MACGHFADCDEVLELTWQSGRVWLTRGSSPCYAILWCTEDLDPPYPAYWILQIRHAPTNTGCTYRRNAYSDCPPGTYVRIAGNCPDCPDPTVSVS
jgi:hypothetical protein